MVVAQSPPIFGPNRPCSSHIIDLLKEYHQKNGPETPQFAYKGRAICQSKVFTRQGKEIDQSLFSIEAPCPYKVLVLHRPGEQDSLVTCRLPYVSKHGQYLVAWQGVEKGYETECCAVRIFNRNLNAIRFSDEVWKELDTMGQKSKDAPVQSKARSTKQPTKATVANGTANAGTNGNTNTTNKNGTPNVNGSANAKTDPKSNTAPESESEYETDTGSDESSEESSSDEESESLPPAKKIKSAPDSPISQSPQSPGTAVIFKLVSYKSGSIRCFPLEECKTGKDLFQKARDFFRLFDRNVDVKILCCQISSRPEQHYLFEGSEGEFSLLVEQVKKSRSQAGDGRCIIEVGHVLSC